MDRNQIRVFTDDSQFYDDEGEEEEALSLSDLPLIQSIRIEEEFNDDDNDNNDDDNDPPPPIEEEFDFCSLNSNNSLMCSADDVFYRGQILPLRHSLTSENASWIISNPTRFVSRSESLDRFYSSRFTITSRSSSSASSSNNSNPPVHKFKPRFNQFHSHPSPSPRTRFTGNKSGSIPSGRRSFGNGSSSSIWNVLKLGLVSTPPEITFRDLNSRTSRNSKSGSRNSSSSTGSSVSLTSSRRKRRSRTAALFGAGGCRCSSSDAVPTVTSRVVTIKRSASEGENRREPESTGGRKAQNHHYYRTFEWIKQLSLDNETAS